MRILTLFKDLIESYYLDGYLVPKNDEYFNEYIIDADNKRFMFFNILQ